MSALLINSFCFIISSMKLFVFSSISFNHNLFIFIAAFTKDNRKSYEFRIFKFSILLQATQYIFFILSFSEFIENLLVLFYYLFYISLEKINLYSLTNFYFVTQYPTQKYPHIIEWYILVCRRSFLISFRIFETPKLSKYVTLSPFICKAIQKSTIKSRFILIIFLHFKIS